MKNKGISLIVLIITIVVIIILAASIILNMSKINIINNANAAVLKQDIATLQSELELYKSDKFVDKRGKYDATKLNADTSNATYGTENIEDKNNDGISNIHDILTVLKKSRYKDSVYIQEGKLVFKKSGLKDEEVEIILEMGLEVDGMPKVTSIETNSEYTSIQISLNVTLAEEVEKVIYILNDGEREESTELTKTYTGLTQGVNYTLEVILVLKDGTEISKKEIISTKSINGKLKYTLSENDWTNKDVIVTIEYSEEIPEGYELQYKLIGQMTQDWTKYTGAITVSENNTTVVGRIYNEILDEEYVDGSSREISKIDKEAPTAPTELILTSDETTITAIANGATDVGSGVSKYMYSLDGITWQESGDFSGISKGIKYTLYTKAVDEAGNESNVITESIFFGLKFVKFEIGKIVTGNDNATINGKNASYNNPVIPVGFKAIETAAASWNDTDNDGNPDGWNNGLVIADENKNEFVWVPCTINLSDSTKIQYTKWSTLGFSYLNAKDDEEIYPVVNNKIIDEKEQIEKYGGFYIGRFEAGGPGITSSPGNTTGVPVVQKGATVWINISYVNAKANSLKFCNTDFVKSGIVTGTAWDTTCAWIQSEKNADGKSVYDVTNSLNWGNYTQSKSPANVAGYGRIQPAGYSDYWKAKNIYDLAGNAWEWGGELNSVDCSYRGGNYSWYGSCFPAAYRALDLNPTDTGWYHSFRIMLYVI